jgi:hypothetical protein
MPTKNINDQHITRLQHVNRGLIHKSWNTSILGLSFRDLLDILAQQQVHCPTRVH